MNSGNRWPRVRTLIKDYVNTSKFGIQNLQANYFNKLQSSIFTQLYAGYFEEMFAGIGGEILYYPLHNNWALGLDINRVRQRGFQRWFNMQDYTTTTGHLSFYHKIRFFNLNYSLKYGKYLAKDWGTTLRIGKRFNSGAEIGAWATKTNVSVEDFGEGSFDKGFYFSIPFDQILRLPSKNKVGMVHRPLLRDGGQPLARLYTLYDVVDERGLNDVHN